MLRRIGLAVAATLVLVVGGGGLAYALWSVSQPLPAVELSTGTFDLDARWVNEPEMTDLFPGDSATGTAVVALDSAASWQYSVDAEISGGLSAHLDTTWYPTANCTGTPLGTGSANGTTLTGGASTEFCLQFTLNEDTPSQMQGQTAQVAVTVTAQQVQS